MTRVTEYFNLGLTQGGVDFVDVDVNNDVPVYIDPTAIRNQRGDWAEACVNSLQSYFSCLLEAIASSNEEHLQNLIYPLVEPNETHLGQTEEGSHGRSLGSRKKANELIESLRNSKAVASGFLRDLEDSALMIPGVDKDIVSDITTCVIRKQLVEYTQKQCEFHKIAMDEQDSSPMWDSETLQWVSELTQLPRAADDKLILVPKSIVRVRLIADKGRYYRGYLRPYFENEVLAHPTADLIRVLKHGGFVVDKGALDEKIGTTKDDIVRNTEEYPAALEDFRAARAKDDEGPLPDEDLALKSGGEVEALRAILEEIQAIAPGNAGATLYHRAVARFLSTLFARALGNQRIEQDLHSALKRMDITYDNVARRGFFWWLGQHFPASMVVVECKNYARDVGNPEFDQIAMRLSPGRGAFGILACRDFEKKGDALARAKVIADDGHGYVVVLDDDDLRRLTDDFEASETDFDGRLEFPLIRERFDLLRGLGGAAGR